MVDILKAQPDLWTQIREFFYNFFNPTLEGYVNFEFQNDGKMLKLAIFGIFVGVILASFSIIFIKSTLGRLVRAILDKQAFDTEQAVTLKACGLEKHLFIRHAVRHGYALRCVVLCKEEKEFLAHVAKQKQEYEKKRQEARAQHIKMPAFKEPKFKKDLSECHFYIPEKDKYTAEMRFQQKGSGYPTFLFVVLGCIICIALLFAFMPRLIRFFDTVVSIFSWKGNLAR